MKKSVFIKIASIVLAAVIVSPMAFAKSKALKERIHMERVGRFGDPEMSTGTFRMEKTFSRALEDYDFQTVLRSKNGCAGFCYKAVGIKTRLLFDEEGRAAFVSAYKQYLQDYDNKKLNRKSKKFQYVYGHCRAYVEWGPFQYSQNAYPEVKFGYAFVNGSPYFVMRVCEAEVSEKKSSNEGVKFISTNHYFMRKQAKIVADSFEESNITKIIQEQTAALTEAAAIPGDEYDDADYEEAVSSPVDSAKNKKSSKKQIEEDVNADYKEE